jgi:glyoxylase-like metal-dependent hydrolase (beta-lactamase superfamily II)
MRDGSGERMSVKFGVPHWVSPLRLLAELGVAPGDVTDIVLTHAHFDHMGSIDRFPRARIHMQKRELLGWIEYLAVPPRFGFLTETINPDDIRHAYDAALDHRLNLVDGDVDDLLPGLHVRLGLGHTPGHQFVVIDTARGPRVVTGDCMYSPYQVTGRGGNGVYVPLTNALGTTLDQLNTIHRIHQAIEGDFSRLLILHDPRGWPDLPLVKEVEGFRIRKAS